MSLKAVLPVLFVLHTLSTLLLSLHTLSAAEPRPIDMKQAAATGASIIKSSDGGTSEGEFYIIEGGITRASINALSGELILEYNNQRHELLLEKLEWEKISRVYHQFLEELLILGYEVEKEDAGASFMVGIDLSDGRIGWEVQLRSFELNAFYQHDDILFPLTDHGLAKITAQRGTLLWEIEGLERFRIHPLELLRTERDLLVFGMYENSLVMLWFDVNTGEFVKRMQPVPGLCTGSRVRIRKSPSLDSPVLGHLDRDDRVSMLRRSERKMQIDSMDDYWFEVRTASRLRGWSYGHFIAFDLSFTSQRATVYTPEERLIQVLELLDGIDNSLKGLRRIDTLIGAPEEGVSKEGASKEGVSEGGTSEGGNVVMRLILFYDGENPVKLRVEEPGDGGRGGTWTSYYFEDGMLIFAQTPFSGYLFQDGRLILLANEYRDPLYDIPEKTRAEQEHAIKTRLGRYLSTYGFRLK
jgi:hypothetical protein